MKQLFEIATAGLIKSRQSETKDNLRTIKACKREYGENLPLQLLMYFNICRQVISVTAP